MKKLSKKEFRILQLISLIDCDKFMLVTWRKNKFFKEIYKDTHPIFNKSDYKKWYETEYNKWKNFSLDEKIGYISQNIQGIEEYENKTLDYLYSYSLNSMDQELKDKINQLQETKNG